MARMKKRFDEEGEGTEINPYNHVIEIPFGQIIHDMQKGLEKELLDKMSKYLDTGELWPKVQSAIEVKARQEIVRIGESIVDSGFINEDKIKEVIQRHVKFKVKELIEQEVTNAIASSIKKTAKAIVAELNIEEEVKRTIGEKGKTWMTDPGETLKLRI